MAGEKEAGRARGLGGKAEAPGEEWRLDCDLAKGCGQRPAFQPFLKGPSGINLGSCFDDEKAGRIEAEGEKSRPVGAPPLMGGFRREAPQDEGRRLFCSYALADRGKGEGNACGRVAIRGRLDFVQAAFLKPVQGELPLPERGRAGEGVRPNNRLHPGTPTLRARRKAGAASLPLAGGGNRR